MRLSPFSANVSRIAAMSSDSLAARAAAVLQSQPFSRLLGAELAAATETGVELALEIREEHRQQYGMAHGGVISYLADNALTFAGGIALECDVVTAQMNIHYLRPALGSRLIARAQAISASSASALTKCDVLEIAGREERRVAFATGLVRRAPRSRGQVGA